MNDQTAVATEPEYVEVPHSITRKTIARRLTESKQQVPHFYVKASCRIDALLEFRAQLNQDAVTRVSVNDLLIRAIALAMRKVPDANVAWDEKVMKRYKRADVAVAVATPRGLVTPIVRAADDKSVYDIAAEVKELAARARVGKLLPAEYSGGTVTISNLGMFGVEEFSAILNPPQSCIFAVGAGEQRLVVIDGKSEIATMMNVTISVDHRSVDGAIAAQMLAAFKAIVENPSALTE